MRAGLFVFIAAAFVIAHPPVSRAETFRLPTANKALYEPGGEERFFVGTVGKPWTSGTFGCVRSDGHQLHEGLDIRCLQRDKHGEPTDPVMAAADGVVAYINKKSALSNYGKYVILRHQIDGLEIYSLYAHLSDFPSGLSVGQQVKAGETIATMGRTSNTAQGISKDRAHVHFELDFFVNDSFPSWYRKNFPDQRNDHGQWNGQNLVGLDPQEVLLQQHRLGDKFNLLHYVQNQTVLCRVVVRDADFPYLKRYAALIKPNPTAAAEGIAGYEIALNFNAVPVELIPRAASELKSRAKYQLLSVNAAEQAKNPCRKLVVQRGGVWQLGENGLRFLDLLTR